MTLKSYIPWWGKILAKLVLFRLPIGYELWKKLALFQHGAMEEPSYAYQVFKFHYEQVQPREGFVSLELGPGDSVLSAVISRACGGSESYLVDNGVFVSKNLQPYQLMEEFLLQQSLPVPNVKNLQSLEEILAACSAHYMTQGLLSLQTIPTASVDFIWSHAVLEHVRKGEFLDTMRELRRIIRDGGACSHAVDLRDHLNGALDNLRFPENVWESSWMSQSGFYTNRIQYSQMLKLLQQAKFDVEVIKINRWEKLPTPRAKLSKVFRHLSDEELCVSGFSVLLRPI